MDLDFEGGSQMGGTPELQLQRYPHAEFLKELGDRLHELGKELSVCSFHSPCWNAPNEAWWPLWVGIVDRVRIMGYEDIYEANNRDLLTEGTCRGDTSLKSPTAFFKYSYKSEYGLKCWFDSTIMSIGLAAEQTDTWGGGNCQKHLQDILNLPAPMGVCLWDCEIFISPDCDPEGFGVPNSADLPSHMSVDWVRAWEDKGEVGVRKTDIAQKIPRTQAKTGKVVAYDIKGRRISSIGNINGRVSHGIAVVKNEGVFRRITH